MVDCAVETTTQHSDDLSLDAGLVTRLLESFLKDEISSECRADQIAGGVSCEQREALDPVSAEPGGGVDRFDIHLVIDKIIRCDDVERCQRLVIEQPEPVVEYGNGNPVPRVSKVVQRGDVDLLGLGQRRTVVQSKSF